MKCIIHNSRLKSIGVMKLLGDQRQILYMMSNVKQNIQKEIKSLFRTYFNVED